MSSFLGSCSAATWTRRVSVPMIWILAPLMPRLSMAVCACDTDTPGALPSTETPPSKSMPRFRPRVNNDRRLMTISTAESVRPRFHHRAKSISFSPR